MQVKNEMNEISALSVTRIHAQRLSVHVTASVGDNVAAGDDCGQCSSLFIFARFSSSS